MAEGVPPGWVRVRDPGTGEDYYWHEESDRVTWEKPALGTEGAKRLLTTHTVLDGTHIRKMEWLDDWMEREELFLDVIWPSGASPSAGAAALVEQAWRCSSSDWSTFGCIAEQTEDGVSVKSGTVDGLPVFSSEWALDEDNATLSRFLEFHLRPEHGLGADEAFISADVLTTFGSLARLEQPFAQLVRWRFNVRSPLQQREALYVAVPSIREDRSAAVVAYISVHSPRFPPEPDFTRARVLCPSFEHATVLPEGGGLRMRHVSTKDMGGLMPDWLWNTVGRLQALSTCAEHGRRVRYVLADGTTDEAAWGLAWTSREGQIVAVRNNAAEGSGFGPLSLEEEVPAFEPGSWAKAEMEKYAPTEDPKAEHAAETLGAVTGSSSVGPDAWALEQQKKISPNKPSPMRNRFKLMSAPDTKASAKIDNVGHSTIDSWQMQEHLLAKTRAQGAFKQEHVGVKGTVNLHDYMVVSHKKYQSNVKAFPLHIGPETKEYQGIKPTIPLNDYLIADQRQQRQITVEADKFQSLPVSQSNDSYLAEHYKQAAALAASATQHSWTEIDRSVADDPMAC